MSTPHPHVGTPGGGFRKPGAAGRRFGGRSNTPNRNRGGAAGTRAAPPPTEDRAKALRGRSASPRKASRSAVVLNRQGEAGANAQDARYTLRGGTPSPLMSQMNANGAAAAMNARSDMSSTSPAALGEAQLVADAMGGFLAAAPIALPPALEGKFASPLVPPSAVPVGPEGGGGAKTEEFSSSLHNISQLRRQIDELQSTHKQEEMMLLNRMKFMLQKSQEAQHSSKMKEEQLAGELGSVEGRLRREMEEKEQAMTLYKQFKDQGGTIISRLSSTLADLQQRYQEDGKRCVFLQKEVINLQQELRQEHAKRAELEHQLAQARLQSHTRATSASIMSDASPPPADAMRDLLQRERTAREEAERQVVALAAQDPGSQVYRLQQLVKEKDARIVVLEQQQAGGRSAAPSADGSTGNSPDIGEQMRAKCAAMEKFYEAKLAEYKEVLERQEEALAATKQQCQQLREGAAARAAAPSEPDAAHVVEKLMSDAEDAGGDTAQNAVIRTLVEQLKVEKRERLKMEEQSDRMLMETNKQVSSLEQRIKQAERTAATPRRTPRHRTGSGAAVDHRASLAQAASHPQRFGLASSDSSLRSTSSSPLQCAAPPPVQPAVYVPPLSVAVGGGADAGAGTGTSGGAGGGVSLEATLSRWKSLRSDARATLDDTAAPGEAPRAAVASPLDALPAVTPLSFGSDRDLDGTRSPYLDSDPDAAPQRAAEPVRGSERILDALAVTPAAVRQAQVEAMRQQVREQLSIQPPPQPQPAGDIRSSATPAPMPAPQPPGDDVEAAGSNLLKRLRKHLDEPKATVGAAAAGAALPESAPRQTVWERSPRPAVVVVPDPHSPERAASASPATKACSDSIFELEKQLEELLADFK